MRVASAGGLGKGLTLADGAGNAAKAARKQHVVALECAARHCRACNSTRRSPNHGGPDLVASVLYSLPVATCKKSL